MIPEKIPRDIADLANRITETNCTSNQRDRQHDTGKSSNYVIFNAIVNSVCRYSKTSIFIIIGIILLYLTLRSDSSFGSVTWIPSELTKFLEKNIFLRNFWGFLPIGMIVFLAYKTFPVSVKWERGQFLCLLGLSAIPIVKELVQIPLAHRHCNWSGILSGLGGLWLGLLLGFGCKCLIHCYRKRKLSSSE
jgi:hypothetical protein